MPDGRRFILEFVIPREAKFLRDIADVYGDEAFEEVVRALFSTLFILTGEIRGPECQRAILDELKKPPQPQNSEFTPMSR
jgi:hypothetical protein